MPVLIQEKQLDSIRSGWLGTVNYNYPAAASSDVTANITALLASAGDGGTALPVQVSTGITVPGVITTAPNNVVQVRLNTTKQVITTPANNEVYGRMTEAAGTYTIALYSLIAGVETAYTPASPIALDYYFAYRFTSAQFPTDNNVSVPIIFLYNDPSAVISQQATKRENLTVTGTNVINPLTITPDFTANVFLTVNGQTFDTLGGAGASFTVAGTAIIWSAVNAGFSLVPSDYVTADYTYTI